MKKSGKTLSCFPLHFFCALLLPAFFTTEQSIVEVSLCVNYFIQWFWETAMLTISKSSIYVVKSKRETRHVPEYTRRTRKLKKLCHDLRILETTAEIFEVRRLKSMVIFPILNHPCSFFCLLLFRWCFYLSKQLFLVFLQFKCDFVRSQITQNTDTELLWFVCVVCELKTNGFFHMKKKTFYMWSLLGLDWINKRWNVTSLR